VIEVVFTVTTAIGIIGTGNIGGTLARLFTKAGYDVIVSNSRGPQTLQPLVDELGPRARAATAADAARLGDVVVVSLPFGRYREVPTDGLAGKVVIDTNSYYPDRDGRFPELDDDRTTSSELLAAHLGSARVVKAFNQIPWQRLGGDGRPTGAAGRTALPIAGDDADAKQVVAALIDEIGFDAVDTGVLATGRLFQPGGVLYVPDVTAEKIHAAMRVAA
jgi:predicted dinucleotide-binding enzyme